MLNVLENTRQIKNTENTQIKYNSEKNKQRKIQQNKTTLVQSPFYDTWKQGELILQCSRAHMGQMQLLTLLVSSDFFLLMP